MVQGYNMNIRDILLEVGGSVVILPESLPDTLTRLGHFYDLDVRVPEEGASKYFIDHEDEVRVMWGFVLDENGLWKMHSWLIKKDEMIIIDNYKYVKYYGFVKQTNVES